MGPMPLWNLTNQLTFAELASAIHMPGFISVVVMPCLPLLVVLLFLLYKLNKPIPKPVALLPTMDKQIIRLAFSHGGTLTVSDVAIGTDFSLAAAEYILDSFVSRNYVQVRVAEQGVVLYDFPGIAAES
jgi:hypothetical protein